ncbi:MAG: NAD(P)-binding domain-containing protein [Methanomassiliicoccales archaeon]|nr:NAD(P)-binding domain-containing protein [Methanomassiliicoccales archaeon]
MRVGMIGRGNVGKAIGDGLKRAGHGIRYGHPNPKENGKDAAA